MRMILIFVEDDISVDTIISSMLKTKIEERKILPIKPNNLIGRTVSKMCIEKHLTPEIIHVSKTKEEIFEIIGRYEVPILREVTLNQIRGLEIERFSFKKTILVDDANNIIFSSTRRKQADYNSRQRFNSCRIKEMNTTSKKVLYKKASRGNKK